MGWGVKLDTEIAVSGVYKEQVADTIELNESLLASLKRDMYMYAVATPKDILTEEEVENGAVSAIQDKLNELFDVYDNIIVETQNLYLIKENFDKAENF